MNKELLQVIIMEQVEEEQMFEMLFFSLLYDFFKTRVLLHRAVQHYRYTTNNLQGPLTIGRDPEWVVAADQEINHG